MLELETPRALVRIQKHSGLLIRCPVTMTARKSPGWLIVTFAVALRPDESNFKKKKG